MHVSSTTGGSFTAISFTRFSIANFVEELFSWFIRGMPSSALLFVSSLIGILANSGSPNFSDKASPPPSPNKLYFSPEFDSN